VGVRVSDAPGGVLPGGLTGAIVGSPVISVGLDVMVKSLTGSGSQGSTGLAVGY